MLAAPALMRSAFAQEAEYSFKIHHFLGPKAPAQTKMMEPWARRIEEESEGRVKFEIYPSMSLGGTPPQLFRQVAQGVVDIVWTLQGYTPGLFPRSEIFELPTVYVNDPAAANLAMREMFDEYLAPEYEAVHVLYFHVHAGQAMQMANSVVRSPADLAGKKMRVPGPTGIAVLEALGSSPVSMPIPDLPQALATSAIDGALSPFEVIPALQLQDKTKYQIEGPNSSRFGTSCLQFVMNKERWAALPEDIQDIFNRNSGEDWLREVGNLWRANDDAGIKIAVDSGNEHIILSEAEMAEFDKALGGVVDSWVARNKAAFDAQAIADRARTLIAQYSK
jgi:TRAP-type C4-dicarboxylate transport system substrate-binding protein